MSLPLRHAGIMFLVLVFALVALPCGAGECGSYAHGCFVHSKAVAGLRGVLVRVGAACVLRACGGGDTPAVVCLSPLAHGALLGSPREMAPLRI